MNKLFGEQLRKERKKRGFTMEVLAKACGISRSYVTLMESGARMPAKKNIPVIAAALKIKTTVVLNWYLEDIRTRMNLD
jgi:transcriptional regulator with XRE-family HTH domain